jgi:hypothetical protein
MKQHKISVKAPKKGLIPFENYRALLKSVGIAMLEELEADLPCEISLRFEDGEVIRALNHEFRGVDRVTDVLSFPLCELVPGDKLSEAIPAWELENGYASLELTPPDFAKLSRMDLQMEILDVQQRDILRNSGRNQRLLALLRGLQDLSPDVIPFSWV